MSSKYMELCPFREGSASRKIYEVLARASKPLTMDEIASRSKVPHEKTVTLVSAYQNKFHNAPMRRAGVAIVRTDDGFGLDTCKADPDAIRPERGEGGKKAKKKAPKKAQSKPTPKPKAKKVKATKKKAPASPDEVASTAPQNAEELPPVPAVESASEPI